MPHEDEIDEMILPPNHARSSCASSSSCSDGYSGRDLVGRQQGQISLQHQQHQQQQQSTPRNSSKNSCYQLGTTLNVFNLFRQVKELKKKKRRRESWDSIQDSEFDEMDGPHIHFRPEALDTLCNLTKFSKRELQMMYRGFKQEAPSGVVREETFKHIYSQFFPKGADTNMYAHYVFNTFDPERNGVVTFTDFVIGLSVLSRGNIHDKLKWTFSLYDVNGDGVISKDDLSRIIISVYDLMGKCVDPAVDETTYKEHIDKAFQKLDLDQDGVVTLDEFIEACTNDESIIKSLNVFNTML